MQFQPLFEIKAFSIDWHAQLPCAGVRIVPRPSSVSAMRGLKMGWRNYGACVEVFADVTTDRNPKPVGAVSGCELSFDVMRDDPEFCDKHEVASFGELRSPAFGEWIPKRVFDLSHDWKNNRDKHPLVDVAWLDIQGPFSILLNRKRRCQYNVIADYRPEPKRLASGFCLLEDDFINACLIGNKPLSFSLYFPLAAKQTPADQAAPKAAISILQDVTGFAIPPDRLTPPIA